MDVKYFTVPVSRWLSIEAGASGRAGVGWLLYEQAVVLFVGLMGKWGLQRGGVAEAERVIS